MRLLGLGFGLLVVLGMAAAGLFYMYDQNLPVYEEGQRPPVDGIAVNTLSRGDETYVSGPFEFSLEVLGGPFDVAWTRRIGRSSRALDVYRPNGHDGSQYLFARGEMMPDTVYHNSSAPPVTLANLEVTALEFVYNTGGSPTIKRTSDEALIHDLLSVLAGSAGVRPGTLASSRIYHVRLLSDQLPGLAYFAYVIFDDQGKAYLAHRAQVEQQWIPADDQLSRWLQVTG